MGLGISVESGASSAIAEVVNGHLIVTVSGGSAPSLSFNLTSPNFDTIGRLYQSLHRAVGYVVQLDEDAYEGHPSIDIESFGPVDILGTGVELKHHRFSDSELLDVLQDAITRHNPSFHLSTIPPQELAFVFQLAHANVCRIMASDAVKRRGTAEDVQSLLALAGSYETAYNRDTRRLSRAITSPKEADSDTMGVGDVVVGFVTRRSPRTGLTVPIAGNIPPNAAVIFEPEDSDVEDTNVRVRWKRNKDLDFYAYELWMDSRPEVARAQHDETTRQTTSTIAFKSYGPNAGTGSVKAANLIQELGQTSRGVIIKDLEPSTDYYFRLYITDLNYEGVASEVVRIQTRAARCKFHATTYASALFGAAGDVVHLYFDSTMGAFTASHRIMLGEKQVTPTIISGTHATFVVPTFLRTGVQKSLTVISPNGLIDVKLSVFTVTA
jgi:hypothetical protein